MRFKRAMAASMAAVMAVSSAVVCQITASAAADETTLSTGSLGSAELTEDQYNKGQIAKPTITLDNKWGNATSLSGYGKVVVSYTCDAVDDIANIYLVAQNGTVQWHQATANPQANGTITLDLSDVQDKTYEAICLLVEPASKYSIGDTFDPKFTVTSATLYSADTRTWNETELNVDGLPTTKETDTAIEIGTGKTLDPSKYSDEAKLVVYYTSSNQSGWGNIQVVDNSTGWDPITTLPSKGDGVEAKGEIDLSTIKDMTKIVLQNNNGSVLTKITVRDVEKSDVEVSSITIEGEAKRTATYGDADVELTVKPDENATTYDESKVTWASSNEDVATVSADGKVTFVGAGSAKITATYDDNKDITASVDFTVAQKAVTMTIKTSDVTDATVDDAQTKAEDSIVLSTAVTPLSPDDYELTVKLADDKKSYTASVALTEKGKTKYALTCEPASGKITYKVTGLKLSTDKLPILASNTDGVQLTATVLPADLAEGEIEWTTADNTVATVENGLVKPVSGSAGGKTTITAAVKGTDVKATCEVSIVEEVNPAVSIKLDKEELSGTAGDKAELKADVTAQDTSKDCTSIVVWKSSDEKVATVSNGVVTFVGEGTAEITATAGDVSAVCKVSVKAKTVAVEKVTLDKTSAELTVGDTATLKASVTPDNATDKTVTWTSSDDSVASVKDGVVTAVKAGTATITAKSGDKTATCTVTVKDKKTIFSGKADIKPTELNSWNDNVQIGAANVEETSVIRIRYSIIDGAQHQIKVQDGADWKALTSIKTNEWGVTEVSKDGVLVIELNKADAEAVAKGGLAITGIGIRVEDVDFNVVEDSKKYPASTATKTEFVKTTVNSDNTLNMLAVFSISEEDAKNFEAFVVTVKRSSDSKIYYDIVETYYDAFDYTADGVMHEGVSENGKHLIVLNLVNADPSWGSITVKIEPAVPKG